MDISDYFEHTDEDVPVGFLDPLGEHSLTNDMRDSIVYASLVKFYFNEDVGDTDVTGLDEATEKLAHQVQFHGPYTDIEDAIEEAKERKGLLIAPKGQWTATNKFVYIGVVTN